VTSLNELKSRTIHTYNEVLEKIQRRLKKIKLLPPSHARTRLNRIKTIYLRKLDIVYNIVSSELDNIITTLGIVSGLHPFYKELFKIYIGYTPESLIKYYRRKKSILKRIYDNHRYPIKITSDEREARIRYRSGVGRILSVIKRRKKTLELLRNTIIELSKMPTIEEEDVKVIVAGMPQVGKSTLISRLSTAKPEIAHYPFTTKTIIVGHRTIDPSKRIVFIDTPGILDRPLEYKNEIEMKAVLALKYLADKTIYLFDVSPSSYYGFNEQLRVLHDVLGIIENNNIIICINKIDITPPSAIEEARVLLSKILKDKPILEISAKEGIGLNKLLETILKDP